MSYTVKKLAEISGVSVRTLHWYDEVGLLKPAYVGENNYRYYETPQLLKLQQILFYKELGFPLLDIQKILSRADFDQVEALSKHRKSLEKKIRHAKELIETIDNTLKQLKGDQTMIDENLYKGFAEFAAGKGGESYFIANWENMDEDSDESIVLKSAIKNDNATNWTKEDWEKYLHDASAIYANVAQYIDKNIEPIDPRVQKAIKAHCDFSRTSLNISREVYVALANLYATKKEYRDQLDVFHPMLHDFMSRAMKIYAYNDLV